MSRSKWIEKICAACALCACLICVVMYGVRTATGADVSTGHQMAYEQALFDTSKVHSIDIVMNDWDTFVENCENEEYATCTVVVDGESFKNVAIRAKGNTSLSNVKQLGSQRYSFKIEFDHYESAKTYHGLDKLSLNNIIQDDTYMKDYLTYTMMREFGVDAPLTSYTFITVNGQDWGLYLAVEAVEDSFLERVYGTETGELYKPDSMSFGGGRGNGRNFDMDEFMNEQESEQESTQEAAQESTQEAAQESVQKGAQESTQESAQKTVQESEQKGAQESTRPSLPGGGFGGMGSADVRLQYIDDDPSSYSNIFDNAKTDITLADKRRLIESLRKLSEGEDLEDVLDMDEVLRYFVVHDYVCNGDSYTGTMVHNYYLHESDGKLSMIPWDYNLAFGGFNGGDATSLVNSPIDDPTASGFSFGNFAQDRGTSDGSDSQSETAGGETPNGMEMPSGEGMPQMPEGVEMPSGEGMPQMPSGEGMPQMPSGMTMSGGGGTPQMPEGMEMPSGEGMPQMPEGVTAPNGEDMPSFPGEQNASSGEGATNSDSRPMVDWIFTDEQYTQAYHELYQQFMDEVDVQALIDQTAELIAPYVQRDPTKFCTDEEFTTAVDTLRSFCALRTQSIQGQLDGTIPSTQEGQQEDSSTLVDASGIQVSDMGSMAGAGGGFGQPNEMPNATGGFGQPNEMPDDTAKPSFDMPTGGNVTPPADMSFEGGDMRPSAAGNLKSLAMLGASVAVLMCAYGVTFLFRRP